MFWFLVVWFLVAFFGGAFLLFVLLCWLTGFPVLCIWDAQDRHHFKDCHHRHDERSNGAKKHLIVVDLWRPWKYNTSRAKEITDQLWYILDGERTRRVSPFRPSPRPPLRCRRFA